MTPQRRAALVSVVAASALIAIKLVSGLASGSLGLVAESLHSEEDSARHFRERFPQAVELGLA